MARKKQQVSYDNSIDFTGMNLSQYAQQNQGQGSEQQPEEKGFWDKVGESVEIFGEGLGFLPSGLKRVAKDTYNEWFNDGRIDVNDLEAIEARRREDAERQAFLLRNKGKGFEGLAEAMLSAPYSLATMAGSAAGGAARGAVGGLGGSLVGGALGLGAGMLSSGAIAYGATKQDFKNRLLDTAQQALGRMPTQEEWNAISAEFEEEAKDYGLWEALPEAVSNAFMLKLFGGGILSGGLKSAAKKLGAEVAQEEVTEGITQYGQGGIDAQMGWREKAPTYLEAQKEVFYPTLWGVGLNMGAHKLGSIGYNYAKNKFGFNTAPIPENTNPTDETPAQEAPTNREQPRSYNAFQGDFTVDGRDYIEENGQLFEVDSFGGIRVVPNDEALNIRVEHHRQELLNQPQQETTFLDPSTYRGATVSGSPRDFESTFDNFGWNNPPNVSRYDEEWDAAVRQRNIDNEARRQQADWQPFDQSFDGNAFGWNGQENVYPEGNVGSQEQATQQSQQVGEQSTQAEQPTATGAPRTDMGAGIEPEVIYGPEEDRYSYGKLYDVPDGTQFRYQGATYKKANGEWYEFTDEEPIGRRLRLYEGKVVERAYPYILANNSRVQSTFNNPQIEAGNGAMPMGGEQVFNEPIVPPTTFNGEEPVVTPEPEQYPAIEEFPGEYPYNNFVNHWSGLRGGLSDIKPWGTPQQQQPSGPSMPDLIRKAAETGSNLDILNPQNSMTPGQTQEAQAQENPSVTHPQVEIQPDVPISPDTAPTDFTPEIEIPAESNTAYGAGLQEQVSPVSQFAEPQVQEDVQTADDLAQLEYLLQDENYVNQITQFAYTQGIDDTRNGTQSTGIEDILNALAKINRQDIGQQIVQAYQQGVRDTEASLRQNVGVQDIYAPNDYSDLTDLPSLTKDLVFLEEPQEPQEVTPVQETPQEEPIPTPQEVQPQIQPEEQPVPQGKTQYQVNEQNFGHVTVTVDRDGNGGKITVTDRNGSIVAEQYITAEGARQNDGDLIRAMFERNGLTPNDIAPTEAQQAQEAQQPQEQPSQIEGVTRIDEDEDLNKKTVSQLRAMLDDEGKRAMRGKKKADIVEYIKKKSWQTLGEDEERKRLMDALPQEYQDEYKDRSVEDLRNIVDSYRERVSNPKNLYEVNDETSSDPYNEGRLSLHLKQGGDIIKKGNGENTSPFPFIHPDHLGMKVVLTKEDEQKVIDWLIKEVGSIDNGLKKYAQRLDARKDSLTQIDIEDLYHYLERGKFGPTKTKLNESERRAEEETTRQKKQIDALNDIKWEDGFEATPFTGEYTTERDLNGDPLPDKISGTPVISKDKIIAQINKEMGEKKDSDRFSLVKIGERNGNELFAIHDKRPDGSIETNEDGFVNKRYVTEYDNKTNYKVNHDDGFTVRRKKNNTATDPWKELYSIAKKLDDQAIETTIQMRKQERERNKEIKDNLPKDLRDKFDPYELVYSDNRSEATLYAKKLGIERGRSGKEEELDRNSWKDDNKIAPLIEGILSVKESSNPKDKERRFTPNDAAREIVNEYLDGFYKGRQEYIKENNDTTKDNNKPNQEPVNNQEPVQVSEANQKVEKVDENPQANQQQTEQQPTEQPVQKQTTQQSPDYEDYKQAQVEWLERTPKRELLENLTPEQKNELRGKKKSDIVEYVRKVGEQKDNDFFAELKRQGWTDSQRGVHKKIEDYWVEARRSGPRIIFGTENTENYHASYYGLNDYRNDISLSDKVKSFEDRSLDNIRELKAHRRNRYNEILELQKDIGKEKNIQAQNAVENKEEKAPTNAPQQTEEVTQYEKDLSANLESAGWKKEGRTWKKNFEGVDVSASYDGENVNVTSDLFSEKYRKIDTNDYKARKFEKNLTEKIKAATIENSIEKKQKEYLQSLFQNDEIGDLKNKTVEEIENLATSKKLGSGVVIKDNLNSISKAIREGNTKDNSTEETSFKEIIDKAIQKNKDDNIAYRKNALYKEAFLDDRVENESEDIKNKNKADLADYINDKMTKEEDKTWQILQDKYGWRENGRFLEKAFNEENAYIERKNGTLEGNANYRKVRSSSLLDRDYKGAEEFAKELDRAIADFYGVSEQNTKNEETDKGTETQNNEYVDLRYDFQETFDKVSAKWKPLPKTWKAPANDKMPMPIPVTFSDGQSGGTTGAALFIDHKPAFTNEEWFPDVNNADPISLRIDKDKMVVGENKEYKNEIKFKDFSKEVFPFIENSYEGKNDIIFTSQDEKVSLAIDSPIAKYVISHYGDGVKFLVDQNRESENLPKTQENGVLVVHNDKPVAFLLSKNFKNISPDFIRRKSGLKDLVPQTGSMTIGKQTVSHQERRAELLNALPEYIVNFVGKYKNNELNQLTSQLAQSETNIRNGVANKSEKTKELDKAFKDYAERDDASWRQIEVTLVEDEKPQWRIKFPDYTNIETDVDIQTIADLLHKNKLSPILVNKYEYSNKDAKSLGKGNIDTLVHVNGRESGIGSPHVVIFNDKLYKQLTDREIEREFNVKITDDGIAVSVIDEANKGSGLLALNNRDYSGFLEPIGLDGDKVYLVNNDGYVACIGKLFSDAFNKAAKGTPRYYFPNDSKKGEQIKKPIIVKDSEGKLLGIVMPSVVILRGKNILIDTNKLKELFKKPKNTSTNEETEEDPLPSIAGEHLSQQGKTNAPSLSVARVQAIADKIGEQAVNARKVKVVQSMEDLAKEVQGIDASKAHEGVYDPQSDTIYLVADNLRSPERVAEVWVHEQVVHGGLRNILSGGDRTRLMNQLYAQMGGRENPLIREVSDRYANTLTGEKPSKTVVMEEVLAKLAERRSENLLSPKEQTLWNKFVRAIKDLWNKIVERITGRTGSVTDKNIDALLSALGRNVMLGENTGEEVEQIIDSRKNRNEDLLFDNNTPRASIMDTTDPVTGKRTSLGKVIDNIMTLGHKDLLEVARNNPVIQDMVGEEDMGKMERLIRLPHILAKKYPLFNKIYNVQLNRESKRSAAIAQAWKELPAFFGDKTERIEGKDREKLVKLIHELDGKEMPEEQGIDKLTNATRLANGRMTLKINPQYYAAFERGLDAKGITGKTKDAMIQLRKFLDKRFIDAYNKMAEMNDVAQSTLDELRNGIGMIKNYFPHHRYGDYYVSFKDSQGKTVFRQHYDAGTERLAQLRAQQIINENKSKYQNANPIWGKNKYLPDDVLGAPIDTEAMTQIMKQAARQITDPQQRKEVEELLLQSSANILKSRGWGGHSIKRQNIPGYEMEDVEKVIYDYTSGQIGWLTKLDASREMIGSLNDIDARKTPELYGYSKQYISDMLRNSDKTDRVIDNVKSLLFFWYLGLNIKTAVVNATQNPVVGVPRLRKDIQASGWAQWFNGANDAIHDMFTGGKYLQGEDRKLIEEMFNEGMVTDRFNQEVRGRIQGEGMVKGIISKMLDWAGKPMGVVEKFNRSSLALAAFRAARAGKLTQEAQAKYGISGQATYKQAKEFATDVVNDSHFVYGRGNQSEFQRKNRNAVISPMFTFRSYSHNYLDLLAYMLKGDKQGKRMAAESLGMSFALGGVAAIPFFMTLSALFGAVTGDDEDAKSKIRKYMKGNNMLRDVVLYGAPSLFGTTFAGSMALDTPVGKPLQQGGTLADFVGGVTKQLVGSPAGMIDNMSRAIEAAKTSNWKRAVEEVSPTFLKNIMAAQRMYNEGLTNVKGTPLSKDEDTRLKVSEAITKGLGFQPLNAAVRNDTYMAGKAAESRRSSFIDEQKYKIIRADPKYVAKMKKEVLDNIKKWNADMKKSGRPEMTVTFEDVMKRVKRSSQGQKMNKFQKAAMGM